MPYILQLGVILGASFGGEILRRLIPLPVPAGVYGLCILLALLMTGAVKKESIEPTARFLIQIMPILFVPAAAGIMQSWGLLKASFVPFIVTATLITALVMGITALIAQRMEGGGKR